MLHLFRLDRINDTIDKLNKDIDSIVTWTKKFHLNINPGKTQAIILGHKRQTDAVKHLDISPLNATNVQNSEKTATPAQQNVVANTADSERIQRRLGFRECNSDESVIQSLLYRSVISRLVTRSFNRSCQLFNRSVISRLVIRSFNRSVYRLFNRSFFSRLSTRSFNRSIGQILNRSDIIRLVTRSFNRPVCQIFNRSVISRLVTRLLNRSVCQIFNRSFISRLSTRSFNRSICQIFSRSFISRLVIRSFNRSVCQLFNRSFISRLSTRSFNRSSVRYLIGRSLVVRYPALQISNIDIKSFSCRFFLSFFLAMSALRDFEMPSEQVSGEVCVENDCVIEGLLKVPFNRRTYNEEVEIVKMERPTPELNLSMDVKEKQREYTRHFTSTSYGKQEMAYRDHKESVESDNRGNYIEYLSSLSEFDHLLANHLESSTVFRGTSPAIHNDLIFAISGVMIKNIKSEIEEAPFAAIVVDETSDCSNQSQLSIVLRYVDSTANVQERFIGFTNVSSGKTAAALFQHVEGVIAEYNVGNKLIAQTYDGASVMAGNINGLETKVQVKRSGFPSIWSNMENENSSDNTMEPPLKRRKGDDELKYRQLYYSILDRMHMEITDRFSDYGKLQFTYLLDSQNFLLIEKTS
ncbi:hypothetical protein ANN_06327 [Periplaneta americana]|uniref:DUF4371 domain-containing protein n=1 Tax=Periplaneta americana TaxID=6978 RepID=A0ABQ8TF25_PERAM|nr:hypothetical protein ANN_06327 [Periplaneta americana]